MTTKVINGFVEKNKEKHNVLVVKIFSPTDFGKVGTFWLLPSQVYGTVLP